jgi:hypothetical protein
MKKLNELQDECQIEINSKNNIINFPNNNNLLRNKIYDNYSKSNLNSSKLIRNSSMCSFRKNCPLNELILTTENKTKYIPRSNNKIWRDINSIKESIEGKNKDSMKDIFRHYFNKNNQFLNKKYFNHQNNTYINNPFVKKLEKKYIFTTKLLDTDSNYQNLKQILTERKNYSTNFSTHEINNSSFHYNTRNRKKSYLRFDTDNELKYISNKLNKL